MFSRATVSLLMVIGLANTARAIDFGWQPLPEGGIEYLVQVEPELIDAFRQHGFASEIPPGLRGVRRISITVGEGKLPNQGDLAGPVITPPSREADRESAGSQPVATDANRATAPLPILRSGSTKGILPLPANLTSDVTSTPHLGPHDGPRNESAGTGRQALDAAKPEIAGTSAGAGGSEQNLNAAAARPWMPLMAALLALFCSLGANLYLVLIHQGMRTRYRALLERLQGGNIAAA